MHSVLLASLYKSPFLFQSEHRHPNSNVVSA